MQNNPLFTVEQDKTNFYQILSQDFKKRTLYYNIKENIGKVLVLAKNNFEFKRFVSNRAASCQFTQVIKFYYNYFLGEFGYNEEKKELFFANIFIKNMSNIFKNGYITKKDFLNLENSNKYNFKYFKNNIFLDFTEEEDKIYIKVEQIMALIKALNEDFDIEIKGIPENLYILNELKSIYNIFTSSDYDDKAFVKNVDGIFKNEFGIKVTKGELFFLTIFNRLYSFNYEAALQDLNSLAVNLITFIEIKYLSKKLKNRYYINNNEIYSHIEFAELWLKNLIFINYTFDGKEVIVEQDFNSEVLEEGEKGEKGEKGIIIADKIGNLDSISNNISDLILEDYKINFLENYFLTGNINKKNIKITKKYLENYTKKSLLKKGLSYTIKKLFKGNENNSFHYIFLLPLYKASKRFINSNFYGEQTFAFTKNDKLINSFENFLKNFKNDYLEINSFIDIFFDENPEFFEAFSAIRYRYYDRIGRKIPESELEKLIGERELFKRFLIYLAQNGFIELFGEKIKREVIYMSGDGFGYRYGLSRNYEEIDWFEIKYLRYNDVNLDVQIPQDNHISGNDIYLNLVTKESIIEEFSKFSILDNIEQYAILNINRDTLIKAKNTYNIGEKYIFEVFKKLNLKIPKNIEILINSTLNQKADLSILPIGIPVILENIGVFNEFLKLKLFNKYILYSNKDLKLIIFDQNFKSLEKTLNNRKIVYSKVEI